jgi:signal transduction histidine kinase
MAIDLLIAVIQELSLARDLDTITGIVRRAARQLTGADGATFVLRDGPYCFYADEDAITPLWKGRRFPLEACISGWSMVNRTEAIIEDIYADPRIPVEAYRPTFVKSLAMVPIRSAAPIGAIGTYWATRHRATDDEVHLLRSLADSTSIAMENVQLHAERARTERLRTVGTMAAGITHDLKNILNPLGLQLALLRRRVEREPARAGEVIDEMARVVKHGTEIVERMRLFVRHDAGVGTEDCDLGAAARDAIEICGPRIRSGSRFQVDLEATAPPLVHARRAELVSALVNLIVNACEAMPDGGRITIRTGESRQRAWIEVEDDGPGMPPGLRQHVLEPFVTTKPNGTGLGLSVVSTFMQQSGGGLDIDSEVGRGTRIRLEFPAAIAVAPAAVAGG